MEGARSLGGRVRAMVVVDVLSFCTCVDVAVSRGASVYPFAKADPAAAIAAATALGAKLAGPRGGAEHRYSLSPASLTTIPRGARLLLPSPNGSAISALGQPVPVLAGCLRNARAAAAKAMALADGGDIAVIAAGERWPNGALRPAIEDLIGAGAILDALGAPRSPEAEIAREAFRYARSRLGDVIRECVSGQELIGRGYPEDVALAVELNVSGAAPTLQNGAFRCWLGGGKSARFAQIG
jgi:2-phosphosulfolactate phosphatase